MDLPQEDESCKLVDSFAIIVQILMAIVALASLLYKRSLEQPKRPLFIWALDTSKQAISAGLVHFANIFLAYISSVLPKAPSNPCVWYFLNLLLDTTIGVYLLYLSLNIVNYIAGLCGISDIKMGHYGNPTRLWPWFKQLILFLIAWFFVKIIIAIGLLQIPLFGIIAEWILSPISGDRRAQVVFVMFVFPLIMNIIQAWLIDRVIKAKMQHIHEYPPVEVSTNVEDATGVGLLLESNEEEDSFHTCSQRSGSDNASERDVQPARAVNRTKRLRTWSGMLGSLFKRTHEDDYQPVHG